MKKLIKEGYATFLPLLISTQRGDRTQFLRFLITGGLSAGIEFISLIALVEIIGLYYLYANIVAFVIANIFNYFLSRSWVFKNGKFSVHKEFIAFFTFALMGLLLNQFVLWFFVATFSINYKISKLFAICMVVFYNFATKKFIVFKG
ncbi:MAG: GtrA family protein [Bacteroidetes bacterium]|nr:GtrA family protein [Bacteroidota bacterium]